MRAVFVAVMVLGAMTAKAESEACRLAQRAALAQAKSAIQVESQWKCRRLVSVRDRQHRGRADLPYRGLVRTPDACVVAYTVPGDARPHGWLVDRANQISNELMAVNHGGPVHFSGRNTAWHAFPINNNYHSYSFDEETQQLRVSEQVIGLGRFNRFDFSVGCVKQ